MTSAFKLESLLHPISLASAPSGRYWSVALRSPGRHETRSYSHAMQLLHTFPAGGVHGWLADELFLTISGELCSINPATGRLQLRKPLRDASLACVTASCLILKTSEGLQFIQPDGAVLATAAVVDQLGVPVASRCGELVAVRSAVAADTADLSVLDQAGEPLYRSSTPGWSVTACSFADGNRLVLTRMTRDSRQREVRLVRLDSGEDTLLLQERSDLGFVRLPGATAHGDNVAWLRYEQGWPLLCLFNLDSMTERVVNPGEHEDLTDLEDIPQFSPDGQQLLFNSSRNNLRERHLFLHDLPSGQTKQLSSAAGITGLKTWLGNAAVIYSQTSPTSAAELHRIRTEEPASSCSVRSLNHFEAVSPLAVTLPGGVPADLYLPANLKPGERRPALVYAHGGIFRQMMRGFHPSYTYSLLHLINQQLLEQGFIILSVDYRGSTGYGLEFEQANYRAAGQVDVEDCASGARWLASHPAVDGTRIGIWGLSWGGTMVLHALTKHPRLFGAGVSLAGIWDHAQRVRYWNNLQRGQPIYFDGRMDNPAEADSSPWHHHASARNFATNLEAPLLSFHGTSDTSVDYSQQTLLERDALELGKDVETVTLPDEEHVFDSPAAWQLVLTRMTAFLRENLTNPQEDA